MESQRPQWVSNEKKYDRAIMELKKTNQPVTEEAIKVLYIKYGGLVLDVSDTVEEVEEVQTPRRRRTV